MYFAVYNLNQFSCKQGPSVVWGLYAHKKTTLELEDCVFQVWKGFVKKKKKRKLMEIM